MAGKEAPFRTPPGPPNGFPSDPAPRAAFTSGPKIRHANTLGRGRYRRESGFAHA